jgi:hypothetical protein
MYSKKWRGNECDEKINERHKKTQEEFLAMKTALSKTHSILGIDFKKIK